MSCKTLLQIKKIPYKKKKYLFLQWVTEKSSDKPVFKSKFSKASSQKQVLESEFGGAWWG
jgi:hypothetical protein